MNHARKKVCVVTCYKYPDYVRGEVIRQAVQLNPELELISVKNQYKGFLRYIEVPVRLLYARLSKRPDVYIITFRGYEILPVSRMISIGKPLIFDEFINLIEWTVYEHKKLKVGSFWAKVLAKVYSFWLRRTRMVLADTKSHASYSSKLSAVPLRKYSVLPVGADEKVFKSTKTPVKKKNGNFEVLYYGSMLPLHGAQHVLEAAVKLADHKNIRFTLIGGKKEMLGEVKKATAQGANIKYIDRVPLKKLPGYIENSGLCLGGPFGKTVQSDMVITGKTFQFMAMSKPALVGKNKESEIFKDKDNCLIVKQADTAELARVIKWAANNPRELERIAKNGNKLYQEKLSLKKISLKLSDLLNG